MFYVLSEEGWQHLSDDDGCPICYEREVDAIKVAEQLAQENPGETYYVVKPVRASKCDVSAPYTAAVGKP